MRVETCRPSELPVSHLRLWGEMLNQTPHASPFLRFGWTAAVAAAGADVRVTVIEDDGLPVAFWPYQRGRWRIGRAPGSGVCDREGLVGSVALDFAWLVRTAGLSSYLFRTAPASDDRLSRYVVSGRESYLVNLEAGYDDYASRLRKRSDVLQDAERAQRRLERDVGPIRFVVVDRDHASLNRILLWKAAQYRRTGVFNPFDVEWVAELIRALPTGSHDVVGRVSSLLAGDTLIAGHVGLVGGRVWHHWFPAYDTAFRRYAPGMVLLNKMLAAGRQSGVSVLDLGTGDYEYKLRVANLTAQTISGAVDADAAVTAARSAYATAQHVAARLGILRRFARRGAARRFG